MSYLLLNDQAEQVSRSWYFGCVGKLVTPGDCKSSARKALLVRPQPHPPSLRVRLETGKL